MTWPMRVGPLVQDKAEAPDKSPSRSSGVSAGWLNRQLATPCVTAFDFDFDRFG